MHTHAPGASAPIVFPFHSLNVRAFADESGEPWFCAADVCAVLGYANSRQAVQKNCRQGGVSSRDTLTAGGNQELTFINEGNLYRLIIKSRKPEAEAFEREVMEVILPAIRKTGRYDAQPARTALPPPAFDPRHALQAIRDQLDALTAPQRPEPRAQLCALLETTNDLGIWYLLGKAEEVAKEYPRQTGHCASRIQGAQA